jgi:hypothetical protein
MTISAQDIGQLFSVMRATYGHQWPHSSAEDAKVWLRRLGGFQRHEIIRASEQCPRQYPDHPPSLGQFESLVSVPKRANTYLPAPKVSKAEQIANYVLLQVLVEVGGVSKFVLKNLVQLKNALRDEWTEISKENTEDMRRQLSALAKG